MTPAEFIELNGRASNSNGSVVTRLGTLRDFLQDGLSCVADPKTKQHIWNGEYGKFVFITSKTGKDMVVGFGKSTNIDSTIMDLIDLPIYRGVSTIPGEGFGKEFTVFGKEASNNNFDLAALMALEVPVATQQGVPA